MGQEHVLKKNTLRFGITKNILKNNTKKQISLMIIN